MDNTDTLSIGTKIVQKVLQGFIKKMIKTNIGVDMDINFNDRIKLEHDETGVKAHLNVDLSMSSAEFEKLLKLL